MVSSAVADVVGGRCVVIGVVSPLPLFVVVRSTAEVVVAPSIVEAAVGADEGVPMQSCSKERLDTG